jgi:hypothetical protein
MRNAGDRLTQALAALSITELWSVLTVASALDDLATVGADSDAANELRARLFQELQHRATGRGFDALDSLAVRTICESVLGSDWRPNFERRRDHLNG